MGANVAVFARERACMDATDGLVESGGDGRAELDEVSIRAGLVRAEVGAIAGDCRGDWIGVFSLAASSVSMGGSRGVVACPWSVSCPEVLGSIGIGATKGPSIDPRIGDEGSKVSCLDTALRAGLMI